jgi:hypothetical protein
VALVNLGSCAAELWRSTVQGHCIEMVLLVEK